MPVLKWPLTADAFFRRVIPLLAKQGWHPGEQADVILLGDGGPWIWNYAPRLEALGLRVAQILDLYHAREHIWAVAHLVLGTAAVGHQWGDTNSSALKERGVAPVLAALRALRPRGKQQKEAVRKAIDYFETNAERMNYPEYAARGWPLGSGIVESACRLVCGLRVKQPGMRWTLGGVQAILSLRARRLGPGPAWSALWDSCPLRRRPPVASLRSARVHAA